MNAKVRNFVRGPGLMGLAAIPIAAGLAFFISDDRPWARVWVIAWVVTGLLVALGEFVSGKGVGGRGEATPLANRESARFMALAIVCCAISAAAVSLARDTASPRFVLQAVGLGLVVYAAPVLLAAQLRIKRRW